ncbi:MAG: glycoside hydrolase family 43 protein [bacterium]
MNDLEMKENYNYKNPIIQTIYTCDPAPMVYNDRVYLYTGHDEDGSTWFTMNEWRCYSSIDMVNWTDHGSPLDYKEFDWSGGDAWAGQCIERNGKFYFYVPINKKNGAKAVGVAVSDSPTGPFKDPLGHPLVETGTGDIDPTVFIDDDGQAYLYWGNPFLWYVKLNEDMISYDTETGIVKVPLTAEGFGKRSGDPERPTLYEEGPWFYKRNGLYYMVYAASGIPENIAYSTSTAPTGPWTFRGIIMPTQGGSFTNHPGLCDYKGKSYFFYHNGALPGGGGFTRSVCVEEFAYNSDGTIPTLNMTKEGVSPVAYLNPYIRNEAETIAWQYGIKTEPCSQGGMNVCNIDSEDYIKVCNVDFGKVGAELFTACISSVSDGGKIELHLDSPDGELIGELAVPSTGGFDNWKTASTNISQVIGVHDLFFVFRGEGKNDLFKFDYWKFDEKRS